jgi:hypothetical protein
MGAQTKPVVRNTPRSYTGGVINHADVPAYNNSAHPSPTWMAGTRYKTAAHHKYALGVGQATNAVATGLGWKSHPAVAGVVGGLGGAAAGYFAKPVIDYFYPELERIPRWKFALGGGVASSLANTAITAPLYWSKQRYNQEDKKASFNSFNGGGMANTSDIRLKYLQQATHPLINSGMVNPLAAQAFNQTAFSAGNNGITSQQQFGQQARSNGLMSAIGGYVNPINRVGIALAGAGAGLMTRAMGLNDMAQKYLGMPVSNAVRSYAPGAKLFMDGLNMLGNR